MTVRTVSAEEYYSAFPARRVVYGGRAFNAVSAASAQAVRYFVGYDENEKPRLGIVAGYRDGEWHAPYSAPFAEIAYNKPQQIERVYDFISELTAFLGAPLHVTLPPDFYDPVMLPKFTGILANYASRTVFDFDFFFPTERVDNYTRHIDPSARNHLNRALSEDLVFAPTDDFARAYEIIRANREAHRYPLAMSLERVLATAPAVGAECFVMSHGADDVAAALVYHVSDGIVQVIYWGDAPGYNELRPMNIFPLRLFEHYRSRGVRIVDVGPSSTAGIPNNGLCRYKEAVGCAVALKPSFVF